MLLNEYVDCINCVEAEIHETGKFLVNTYSQGYELKEKISTF
jgi:hypothetical protein